MICKQVEDQKCVPPPYQIPIGWFLLEQDIIKATMGDMISREECFGIAAVLNIDAKALRAALEYFDEAFFCTVHLFFQMQCSRL